MRTKLRELRLNRGISQTHMAKKLGFQSASGYANIEMGRNRLTLDDAVAIASILNVEVKELV